uniref:Uncharacterized protein n=1 Tax=Populus alba TaxID=43335 RepID=A0A4U5P2H9_POPAL|nr:hypothetical protein D5086_0000234110 [Populus alba]
MPIFSTSSSTPRATTSLHTLPPNPTSQTLLVLDSTTESPLPMDPDFHPKNLTVLPLSPINLHPMTTRSKNGISKRKAYSATVQSIDFSQVEPSSFKATSIFVE